MLQLRNAPRRPRENLLMAGTDQQQIGQERNAKGAFDASFLRGSCTCALRINTTGSPVDRHSDKKAETRGLSWPPSGPLSPGDALDAGHADARRPLRRSSRAASHHHGWLTPPRVVATAAPETAAPRAASRRDRSDLLPWPAYKAATSWLSPSRWSAGAVATARGG